MTFEEACVRWLEEKAHKKSLDDDKSRIDSGSSILQGCS